MCDERDFLNDSLYLQDKVPPLEIFLDGAYLELTYFNYGLDFRFKIFIVL